MKTFSTKAARPCPSRRHKPPWVQIAPHLHITTTTYARQLYTFANCTSIVMEPCKKCSGVLNPSESIWATAKIAPSSHSNYNEHMHHIHLFVFSRFEKGGLSEHQCFFDTQYFCLLSAANPLIQQSTIMLTLCTTISQFLCFSPFFISMLLLFSKFGETVRKCLLLSAECEGPKL